MLREGAVFDQRFKVFLLYRQLFLTALRKLQAQNTLFLILLREIIVFNIKQVFFGQASNMLLTER